MNRVLTITAITALSFSSMSYAESISAAKAEFYAGSLCMLSQRMAKDYFAIGADIRPEVAMQDLDESVSLFEERINLVMDFAHEHGINHSVEPLAKLWQEYRMDVLAKPDKLHAATLLKHSEALLKACNNSVAAIAAESDSPYAELVRISEEETTLAQKIARDYYAMYWNVETDTVRADFQQSIQQFDQNLTVLLGTNHNTPELTNLLARVESQWKFSNAGFKLDKNGQYVPNVISVTTDSIYKKMENIAYKYELLMSTN
ncbi:type IV pili methyl-accepting chemotaxis transducer N-terminal domain-containing protein [Oceanobacter kriegii]|uniref:type IV pili methyl-accepting chemotaxis transducer N-terminal domain-containing protein n=1 Tax=Oceanobacter kriegii TaxID=64972 RepID=UPI00041D8498|nr:type IV pili methyl-accepting chemotaxis transducer N-terminal domain-containing protein [Oceanobacter kriegii]